MYAIRSYYVRAANVKVGDLELRIGIAHGLGEARKMLVITSYSIHYTKLYEYNLQ